MKKSLGVKVLVVIFLAGLLAIARSNLVHRMNNSTEFDTKFMDELNIFVPFVFSETIDPRSVYTVGDQIVSEHIFAFHYAATIKKTNLPLFSEVIFDKERNAVEIHPFRKVIGSDGKELDENQLCLSLKSSLTGTKHTKYASLIKSVKCNEGSVKIEMTSIPVNFEYWLRSIDFAIYQIENIPLSNSRLRASTGPYSLVSLSRSKVELKRNNFFPRELVSNNIEKINLLSYSPSNIHPMLDHDKVNLAYIYGYSLTPDIVTKIQDQGFKTQVFPNEWLVYLGFQKTVDFEVRNIIASKVDALRAEIEKRIVYGSAAYSTTPADRAYGLNEIDYQKYASHSGLKKIERKLRIATLDEWSKIPLLDFIIGELSKSFDLDIRLFTRKEMSKIYSLEEADLYLSPMGVSASDPLGNYSFYLSQNELFREVLSQDLLVELYKLKSFHEFSRRVKDIEVDILKQRVLIPIGHFPGVIIESPNVIRDENKSWDWGIQAWTYKIN